MKKALLLAHCASVPPAPSPAAVAADLDNVADGESALGRNARDWSPFPQPALLAFVVHFDFGSR